MKRKFGAFSVFWTLIFLLVAVCAYGATHDVSIDRVEVDPRMPRLNEKFKIEALASNQGTDDEHDFEVAFLVGGAETDRVGISQLKTEDSRNVHSFHTLTTAGEYVVAVRALLDGDENPANDTGQITIAAVGDDDDGDDDGDDVDEGEGDDDGDDDAVDDDAPPADDPPPGDGDDTGDGDDPPPSEDPPVDDPPSSDDPPSLDDPPADDPPPADDGSTGDEDADDGFFLAYYYVSVENNTGSAIRFEFSMDSFAYDHALEIASGSSESSDTFWISPGFRRCYGRWQDPGTGQWEYVEQTRYIAIHENEEFAFALDPVYRRVEGRVVDDNGPIGAVDVALLRDGATSVATLRTGGNGRFVFSGLENGRTYSLRITREGYMEKIRDLGRVSSDIELGDVYLEPVDTDPGDDDPGLPVDSDGDGVIDEDDAFPDDPGEVIDTDGDGIGDNSDTDDDGDGMPDSWEIDHGLNPLIDDAAGDPDGDGVTNVDEYAAGTDPGVFEDNFPPDTPQLKAPADAAVGIPVAARLEADGYFDPDGDEHARTRWQIAAHPDFTMPAFDVESEAFLNGLNVPNLVLLGESTYYWRVRFIDSRGGTSPWSAARSFTTRPWAADADRNGIADDFEYIEHSDMDGNGVADLEQENIDCVTAFGVAERVIGILCPEAAGAIECLEVIDPGSIEDETGRPGRMPFGLINFRVKLREPGGVVRLTVYLSEPLGDETAWYKYNPMSGWLDFTEAATFDDNRRVVEIEIRDGGEGDIDGVANGVIVDPSGVGAEAAVYTDDDDDDDEGGTWYVGCFIRCLFK